MGEVKTGALIVIEKTITLEEYEKTGIPIDGVLTSQLLINIFEHNTPLHDGAVIVRNNLREQLHKIQKLAKKPEEKKGWHIGGMRQKVEGEKK